MDSKNLLLFNVSQAAIFCASLYMLSTIHLASFIFFLLFLFSPMCVRTRTSGVPSLHTVSAGVWYPQEKMSQVLSVQIWQQRGDGGKTATKQIMTLNSRNLMLINSGQNTFPYRIALHTWMQVFSLPVYHTHTVKLCSYEYVRMLLYHRTRCVFI